MASQSERIEQLEADNKELTQQMAKMVKLLEKLAPADEDAVVETVITREDNPGPGGGWVITTPVDTYNGKTMGVDFFMGMGIVDVERKNADRIVHYLEHDYGYMVRSVPAADLADFRKRLALNVERAREYERQKQAELLSEANKIGA